MIALRNLLRTKVRTLTTVIGVAVGISVYVSIATIATGLQREARHVTAAYESDIAVQAKGASNTMTSRIPPHELAGLREAFGSDLAPVMVGSLHEEWNAYALVVGMPAAVARRIGIVAGRCITTGEREIMVGSLLARELALSPGQRIKLAQRDYQVVGIYSMGSRFLDGAVLGDISVAQQLLGRDDGANLALIRVRDKGSSPRLTREINSRFPQLTAFSGAEFMGNIRLFRTVAAATRTITFIACFGSVMVVANTLLTALAERNREIGILMAIGWSPLLILRQFLVEGLVLCGIGALAGNGIALLILRHLNANRAIGFGWIPMRISPETFLISCGLALVLAIIALFWPAAVLARFSPAEALRHD